VINNRVGQGGVAHNNKSPEPGAIQSAPKAACWAGRSVGDVIATGTPAGIGMRISAIERRIAAFVKGQFRRAELLISAYARRARCCGR
jgi:hypothetical protein